uniref:RNA-dependent RNA polymerase n=1 Tax=Wuhan insect virus 16 TaxID=1923720 RepID=A0A1L3KPP9_9VIRU|nr:RNA-dependent RNA polymerase [Wuhan insect virus 16]APG79344.1 RNA-dependent RNA polymerase [Wuhan insect virus 16]
MEQLMDYEDLSWVDYLSHVFEIDVTQYRDVVLHYAEPTTLYPEDVPENVMDMVEITEITEEGVFWELKLNEYEGTVGSITSGSKTIKHGEKYKYRHEFVSEAFGIGTTDEKLGRIKTIGDDDDSRTPDFILQSGDVFHVLEIATTKSDRHDIVRRSYDTKMFSYLGALINRQLDKTITYTVIVVTPNRIFSSIVLPRLFVRELIMRMRIALCLEQHLEASGIDIGDDERSEFKEHIRKRIDSDISSLPYKKVGSNPLLIDEAYARSCLTQSNESKVASKLISELLLSKPEIEESWEDSHEDKIRTYVDKFSEGNRRFDLKPISSFPYIVTQELEATSDIPKLLMGNSETIPAVSKLWIRAMDDYEINPNRESEDPEGLMIEALQEDLGEIKRIEVERRQKRKFYHRVSLRNFLSDDDLEALAAQGVWAKKYKNEDFMKARRIHQQSAFKWTTDTSDINEFLNSDDGLNEVEIKDDNRLNLLKHANEIAGNSDTFIDLLKCWRKTELFQSLDIISDLTYEVAIANKQHCKSQEMILKKLRRFKIYMLISPTKSTEHTFLSLFIPNPCKIKFSTVFGKVHRVFGGYLTDFFSLKQSKLENLSSMPASLISLASFWSWFYGLDDASPSSFSSHKEAFHMLKLSLLIRLEDKAQTEETITQSRYMYMEIFKSYFSITPPNPFKILSKLNSYPRSRLNLYCQKQMIKTFQLMLITPPVRLQNLEKVSLDDGEDSPANDQWKNLLNCFTGNTVATASKVMNLFYLGYLKNKMETPEGNTDFQLVEKTCEEEFSLDWNNIKASKGEAEEKPKGKQFNKNCIMHGCDVMENRLKVILGSDWKSIVEKDILDTLTNRMSLELASLKASSSIDHKNLETTASLSTDFGAKRKKVLEAVSDHLEELGINPFMHINKIIEKIENTSGGVICDLFKKQQHGGLREIYVLTIESRIVQLYIETISRVLCSYFEEETLTHPKNKLRKLDQHRSNTARIATREDCIYADFCSSSDKTRWNQNFVMPAMIIPLLRLTPIKFHNSIIRIMNLWTQKLIKLPQRVINLLLTSTQMKSEVYKKLHQEFWNPSSNSVFDNKLNPFIRLTSGMMQGILHYTSSLLHLTFLNSMNKLVPYILKKFFPENTFIMTQVCSSDDSATILSVFSPKGDRNLTNTTFTACRKASQMLEALNGMCNYYCMKNSVKTTTACVDYVEFNSEFLFRNTIAMPIIKFVAASLNITESESFLERFHTMYNLTSDLFSSGFPSYNTYICQLAQGFNHYKTMGSSVNPLFDFWSSQIIRVPDPIYGYFLLDCDLCPGTLGYSYSYWKCYTTTDLLRRNIKTIIGDQAEITEMGGIMQSLIIKHGEVKRWRTMVNSVSKGIDFANIIEDNPELLFREPRTIKELRVSLAIKSTMPSVSKSMRRGNPYLQSLAMSVYAINTHCFSKTTVTHDLLGKVQKDYRKVSLLGEIRKRIDELPFVGTVPRSQVELMFPAITRYEESQKIINLMRTYTLVRTTPFRNRRSEVMVQPFSSFVPLSLMQTCLNLWFGFKVRTSHSILRRCVENYKVRLPWLKDTIKESLISSPFNTYQELCNFVSSHSIRSRLFVRIGPGIFSKRLTGQLFQLIKKSQKEGMVLKAFRSDMSPLDREVRLSAEINSKLSLALTLPTSMGRRSQVERLLKTSPTMYDTIESIQRMNKRDANLCYIQGYVKNLLTPEDIATSIQQTGSGLLISYTKMQEKTIVDGNVKWIGKGQCIVSCEQTIIVVNMDNEFAVSIEVASWEKIRGHASTMMNILNELHLRTTTDQTAYMAGAFKSRFDGVNWTIMNARGTPVFENPHLSMRYKDVKELHLDIGFQSISLTQRTYKGPAAMIRYKTYPGDILPNPCSRISTKIVDAWLYQMPLKSDMATALIMTSDASSVTTETRNWIMDTLMARLSQKGLGYGPGLLSHWTPRMESMNDFEVVEITDEDLDKLYDELSIQESTFLPISEIGATWVAYEPLEPTEELSTESEHFSQWAFAMHNWMEAEIEENIDITSRGIKSFKYLHPLWDDLIDDLERRCPKFWQLTFKGIRTDTESQLSSKIIKMLGIKERARPISLQERAQQLIMTVLKEITEDPNEPSTSGLSPMREIPSKKDELESFKEVEPEDDDDEWFG